VLTTPVGRELAAAPVDGLWMLTDDEGDATGIDTHNVDDASFILVGLPILITGVLCLMVLLVELRCGDELVDELRVDAVRDDELLVHSRGVPRTGNGMQPPFM